MGETSPRFRLPQLAVAQAHKEITHNEALALVDGLLHPVIEGIANSPPQVAEPDAGKCWLVGTNPDGAFVGHTNSLGYWTGSSWRFATCSDGMRVWHKAESCFVDYLGQQWSLPPAFTAPTGGTVVDPEARALLTALLTRLSDLGLVRTG